MRILVVGGGGREHAIAWKLANDSPGAELIAAPGNPGIAELARCVPLRADNVEEIARLAWEIRPDLTVIGPEAPLEAGLADRLRAMRQPVFGPTAAAARIETSKRFAKELMQRAGVPTARASFHTEAGEAKRAARAMGAPLVVKASGLAAGKGVVVCQTLEEAEGAIDMMLSAHAFGAAGSEILLEEFMEGEELSLFAITNGSDVVPLLPAQDHKRLLDGDAGPNTGGMGAYAPVTIGTPAIIDGAVAKIFAPTLAALAREGSPFSGLLYAGLMLTSAGPRVVEFNCRFGDPETEAILPLMESSLLDLMLATARDESLSSLRAPAWKQGAAVTTVVAAQGYPEAPRTGDKITLPPAERDVLVFHAGTRRSADAGLETAGGRVLAVTGIGTDLDAARGRSAAVAAKIQFEGRQFRTDIGWREEHRRAGAS